VHHNKVQFCCSGVTGMIAARSGGSDGEAVMPWMWSMLLQLATVFH
jgi:hypothetical protein